MSIAVILTSVALGVLVSLLFYTYTLYRHSVFGRSDVVIAMNSLCWLALFLLADFITGKVFAMLNISDASEQKLFFLIWVIVMAIATVLIAIVDRRRNSTPHITASPAPRQGGD